MTTIKVLNRFQTVRKPTKVSSKSMTQQHFKDECDINNIVARFDKTGIVTHLNSSKENYGFSDPTTFQEAMNIALEGQAAFDDLPSNVRSHFDHDPAKFMQAVHSEGHEELFADLGLTIAPEVATPVQVEVINQPTEEPTS